MMKKYDIVDFLNKMFAPDVAKLWFDVVRGVEAQSRLPEIQRDLEMSAHAFEQNSTGPAINSWCHAHIKRQELALKNVKNACVDGFVAINKLYKTPNFGKILDIVIRLNNLVRQHNMLIESKADMANITDVRVQITALQHNIYTRRR